MSESQMMERAAQMESEAQKQAKQFSEIFNQLAKEQPELAKALSGMKKEEAAMVVRTGSNFDAASAKKFLMTLGEQMKSLGGERSVDAALLKKVQEQVVSDVSGLKREVAAPSTAEIGKIEEAAGFERGAFVSGSSMEAAPQRMREQMQGQVMSFERAAAARAALQAEEAAKIARMKQPPTQKAA